MKLIIDVDEELAKKQWYTEKEIWTVIKTVWNGTPIPDNATVCDIEQIRAEIVEYKDDKIIHAERNEMIDIVLDIIDKYKAEKESSYANRD